MWLYFAFIAKPKHISNYFLGGLLLALSVRIGKSVFFYFNPDLAFIYLQIGLTACVFIGPSLYFYLRSIIGQEDVVRRVWKYHYGLLATFILTVGVLYPFEDHPDIWRPHVIKSIYYIWLIYLVASAFIIKDAYKAFVSSKDKINSFEVWVLSVFIGNVLIWISFNYFHYTYYIVGALSFSFILYLLVLLLIFSKSRNSILFKNQVKYGNKKILHSEAAELIDKLEHLMKEEKLFKDPSLKLSDVADRLFVIPHRLSQLLNDNIGKSFPIYINEYRIKEAKELLLTRTDLSLEGIGYDCGFNSKSTFYTTFKKIIGTTPAQYKKLSNDND